MSTPEVLIVGGVILVALFFTVRQFIKPFNGAKGSCKACGDTCGCESSKEKD